MVSLKYGFCLLLALLSVAASASAWAVASVEDLRLWRAPDHTRVVFDLSAPVEHKVLSLKGPDRLVLDIDSLGFANAPALIAKLDFSNSPIQGMRHGSKADGAVRVVFDLSGETRARSFLLKASGKLKDRLVVDFFDKAKAPKVVKTVEDAGQRDIVIAIDAGHGGEDPGAIGPGKLYEKRVVLAIAKELEAIFKAKRGYRPVLIRSGDYYVALKKRRDLARKAHADLFVSIHADAFTDSRANGTSVYAVSKRGATTAQARLLAQRENGADLVGGVSLSDKDDVLAGVLADLSMSASLDASLNIGAQVLGQMQHISRLHSKRVEQAGFAVLKSPDIPSILVETGFISNPGESRKLATSSYRRKMARAIYTGVDAYFRDNPPAGTYLAALRDGTAGGAKEHVVSRGDTLSGIAQRYRVSVAALRRTNSLDGNVIRIGQKLQIPAS